jgi:hypothetical protein
VTREQVLDRHGRAYGRLRLAIAFTDGLDGDGAKRITRRGWPNTPRLADPEHGAGMMRRAASRNPALVLGASGLIGLDVDGPAGERLFKHLLGGRKLPPTILVATGKGWHFWFARPAGLDGVAKIELGPDGVEAAKDGYLVAPPARHPSGRAYRFAEGHAPWDLEPAELPREILDVFLAHAKRDRTAAIVSSGPITEGGRHRHLRRVAGAMRRVGATADAIEAALTVENAQRCQPPQPEHLVRELANDIARRYAPAEPQR